MATWDSGKTCLKPTVRSETALVPMALKSVEWAASRVCIEPGSWYAGWEGSSRGRNGHENAPHRGDWPHSGTDGGDRKRTGTGNEGDHDRDQWRCRGAGRRQRLRGARACLSKWRGG